MKERSTPHFVNCEFGRDVFAENYIKDELYENTGMKNKLEEQCDGNKNDKSLRDDMHGPKTGAKSVNEHDSISVRLKWRIIVIRKRVEYMRCIDPHPNINSIIKGLGLVNQT